MTMQASLKLTSLIILVQKINCVKRFDNVKFFNIQLIFHISKDHVKLILSIEYNQIIVLLGVEETSQYDLSGLHQL